MVLTRLGHAAEQPPPRKDTVKSRQRMTTMGGDCCGRIRPACGSVRSYTMTSADQLTTLRYDELAESLGHQTTWPTFRAGLPESSFRTLPSHQ